VSCEETGLRISRPRIYISALVDAPRALFRRFPIGRRLLHAGQTTDSKWVVTARLAVREFLACAQIQSDSHSRFDLILEKSGVAFEALQRSTIALEIFATFWNNKLQKWELDF
jgi:hypothetical protein